MKPVIFRPSAREDVRMAGDWLDEQRTGAGDELLAGVMLATRQIAMMPEAAAVVFPPDVRRVIIERFEQLLFYRVRPLQVVVVALIHGRRRPLDIRRRIKRELRQPDDDL